MKIFKKSFALAALFFMASFSFLAPASADTQNSLPAATFDDNSVVVKFAALSDIHIHGTDGLMSKKFATALDQLNTKADGSLNALMVTGDLTDNGLPDQIQEFKKVIDNSKVDLNKTRFIAALGNHEYYNKNGAPLTGGYVIKDVFGDQAYQGATDQEIKDGDYSTVVNGYHFIIVNCTKYDGGVAYKDSDIAWLKTQLAAAAADDPSKPIFVGSHPMITGTNLGSNRGTFGAGPDLYTVLKEYPQTVYFAGHLHCPETDERTIWQGDFTTVSVGSLYYCSLDRTDENGNPFIDIGSDGQTQNSMDASQGLYIEVDKNNNVKITRMDFLNKKDIKNPWIIPSPKADKSNLLYYTPEQEASGNTAPYFPAGATIKEISKQYSKYKFEFTQAKDNDMVRSYEISFYDKATDKVLKQVSCYSDYYYKPSGADMAPTLVQSIYDADNVLSPFGCSYNKDYYIKIVAVDCFGLKSEPLISDVISPTSSSSTTTGSTTTGSTVSSTSGNTGISSTTAASESETLPEPSRVTGAAGTTVPDNTNESPRTGAKPAVAVVVLSALSCGFILAFKRKK